MQHSQGVFKIYIQTSSLGQYLVWHIVWQARTQGPRHDRFLETDEIRGGAYLHISLHSLIDAFSSFLWHLLAQYLVYIKRSVLVAAHVWRFSLFLILGDRLHTVRATVGPKVELRPIRTYVRYLAPGLGSGNERD